MQYYHDDTTSASQCDTLVGAKFSNSARSREEAGDVKTYRTVNEEPRHLSAPGLSPHVAAQWA
jgi:hypothetical protein